MKASRSVAGKVPACLNYGHTYKTGQNIREKFELKPYQILAKQADNFSIGPSKQE
jgi:hypothetical protein